MASITNYKLFTPLELAQGLTLKNRIVYAPATRARADIDSRVPIERMHECYENRTGAGMIITEGCGISEEGYDWWGAPALYNDEHAAGWKTLVDRVHAKDGKIFLQLWHMGRQSHPSFSAKNEVVSASATHFKTGTTRNVQGDRVGYEAARALGTDEIPRIVEDYRKCAERAKTIGFDGVEVHGANGYLVDQFLQSSTNQRADKYGGSFENRYRFLHEIVEAIKTVYPAERIGVRLSPNSVYGGMGSKDNFEMFNYTFDRLGEHSLAYLALLDGAYGGLNTLSKLVTLFDAKKGFKGAVISNVGLTRDVAEGVLRSGAADLVGFVRQYMANPDLAERFLNDWPLNEEVAYDFYWDAHKGDEGYNTFLAYDASKAKAVE